MSQYKPYPAYKDSGVEWLGKVPEHWEVKKLKWLASLRSGDFITSESIEEEGAYPVYGGNGLRGYYTDFTHEGVYALVGRQGALCGNINYAEGKFWASEHAVVVSPYAPTSVRWLGELLRAMNLGQYSISSAQPGLAVERIIDLSLPIPPERERQIIAAHMRRETNRIDALVEKKTRFIELLREKRQALITHAVTKGLDPNAKMKNSGVEWLGEVPEHWGVGPYKAMIQIENGSDYKEVEADDGYPVIGSGGPFAYSSRSMHDGESVLLGRKGTIDKPLYVNGAFWAVDTMYWSTIKPGTHGRFAYYIATTIPFDMYSTNTALPSMTKSVLSSHVVTFPQFEEQQAIASYLDHQTARLDALADKTELSIALLKERRAALITAAVTGQIDLREDN